MAGVWAAATCAGSASGAGACAATATDSVGVDGAATGTPTVASTWVTALSTSCTTELDAAAGNAGAVSIATVGCSIGAIAGTDASGAGEDGAGTGASVEGVGESPRTDAAAEASTTDAGGAAGRGI